MIRQLLVVWILFQKSCTLNGLQRIETVLAARVAHRAVVLAKQLHSQLRIAAAQFGTRLDALLIFRNRLGLGIH